MDDDTRLSSQRYRPLRPGDKEYSKTSRRMYSIRDGTTISWYRYRKDVLGKSVSPPSRPGKAPVSTPARKPRADKGMDRGTYKIVKAELDARKKYDQEQRRKAREKERAMARANEKPLTLDVAKNRYESAKIAHNEKINEQRESIGQAPIDVNSDPEEVAFYDMYDRIKHPDNYTRDEVNAAHDYFWGDDYDTEYEYDYPDGETP